MSNIPSARRSGFTIVELILIIVILSILTTIVTVGFSGWQRRTADNSVKSDVKQATSSLESYKNFKNDYPPNLAGTNFAPSNDVALKLSTNSPQLRTYSGLTADQNAQLFLNTCNANMPIESADGTETYNTSCTFSGNNIHLKGTTSSNVVLQGPAIEESEVSLTCGAPCDAALATIISEFLAQNGAFPLDVPQSQVSLPEPTTSYGAATMYCLEGTSVNHTDVIYHTTHTSPELTSGPCPDNPLLHYP